jgi:excisionase family DNA binding protein
MPYTTQPQQPETLAVSPSQAAEVIGLQSPTLEKDRRVGHLGIPFVKAGRRVLYRFADLKEWLEVQKQTPPKQGATK